MATKLVRSANVCPNIPFPGSAGSRHRKRSSSLFALNELCPPSPTLSPSVSINSSKDNNMTGEIPIIFDFLTTSSMPSEERISKLASLKPALPPLAKFSPMSAFFPMSDSFGTLNTIITQAFGTKRPDSYYSDSSQQRYSMLSEVNSPLDSNFEVVGPNDPKEYDHAQGLPLSESMPCVQVLDYDVGQEELGGMSQLAISAYLAFSSDGADAPDSLRSIEAEDSANTFENALATQETSSPGERTDIKSPLESPLEREIQLLPTCAGNGFLSVPGSPDSDDKTPTQSMFFTRQSQDKTAQTYPSSVSAGLEAKDASVATLSVAGGLPLPNMERNHAAGSSLAAPSSPDFDDKTPTQATFLKRQTDEKRLSQSAFDRGSQFNAEHITSICPSSSASDLATQPLHHVWSERRELATEHIDELVKTIRKEKPEVYNPTVFSGPVPGNALPVPCLQHAQWLRDTVVELWIDQEGFRAIRPKFFLASVSNGLPYSHDQSDPGHIGTTELTEEHDSLYTTVAEFLPVTRAAHYFHHAALDRAPTLNRITAGGDETRDYITRAATLALRDNGVFFVHGTEDHRVDTDRPAPGGGISNGGGRIIRLNWRFEYFVSNRRPDGRSAHRGEKVITPLSFSCTPALLDKSRANKVKVLHIMKKTLLPNLVAQKLEPPDLPMLQTRTSVSSLASLLSVAMSESHGSVSSYKSSKNAHSKTGSRSRRGSESEQVASATHSFVPPRLKPPPLPSLAHTKHRRGSHSDTTPEDFMRQRLVAASHATHERSRSASHFDHGGDGNTATSSITPLNNVPLIGPIIPREELLKLCDSGGEADGNRRPHSVRLEVVDNMPMTTLPAAPRHKHDP